MLEAALRRNTVGVPPASTAMGPMPPGPTADLETLTLMSAHSLMSTWDQNSTLVPRTHAMDGVPTVFTPTQWNLTPTCPANQRITGIAKISWLTLRAINFRQTELE